MLFRVEHNVPDYYVEQSRDFQLLCRLYDLALQSSRYSINSLTTVSNTTTCNDNLLPLIGTKVGFFDNLEVVDESTRKIISCFPYIVQYKGSLKAINMIANVFGRITNAEVEVEEDRQNKIFRLLFSTPLRDTDLFYKLVEYIRPAGFIIEYDLKNKVEPDDDRFTTTDTIRIGSKISAIGGTTATEVKNSFRDEPSDLSLEDEGAVGFTQITGTVQLPQEEPST